MIDDYTDEMKARIRAEVVAAQNGDMAAIKQVIQWIAYGQIDNVDIRCYLSEAFHQILENLENEEFPAADLALGLKRPAHRPKGKPKLFRDIAIAVRIKMDIDADEKEIVACYEAERAYGLNSKEPGEAARKIYNQLKETVEEVMQSSQIKHDHYLICRNVAYALNEDPDQVEDAYVKFYRRKEKKRGQGK